MSLQETIEAIRSKPLLSEPGSKFMYSNSGYVMLAGIIEKASGMRYGDYLKQNLWEPLGLKETGEASASIPVLQGYVSAGDQIWAPAGPYISQSGTGTLYSTVDDMLTWTASFETEQVLSPASIDQMFTPYSEKNYGYGWMIRQENGTTRVFHNGSGTGYATGMSRELGGGYTIILLGNHAGVDTLTLMTELRKRLP
jgi:CubicO group peptidase (beta-lactamase class C family)